MFTVARLSPNTSHSRSTTCDFDCPSEGTGARLEELCQLRVDDFTEQQGIQCIHIDDSREGQNLKNASSRRIIPLHPALLDLGLLQHVESVRASGADRLFSELEAVRGKLGHAPSKWFGRYKTKLGITDSRKTFHSFRHMLIDDLRDAGVQDSLIKRIGGHEDGSLTFSVYGSRSPEGQWQMPWTASNPSSGLRDHYPPALVLRPTVRQARRALPINLRGSHPFDHTHGIDRMPTNKTMRYNRLNLFSAF